MIKKSLIITFCLAISTIFSGCGEHVIINGKSYRVLSEKEEQQMLLFARVTLVNSGDKLSYEIDHFNAKPGVPPPQKPNLTQAEKNFIMNTMPEIQLSYTGNRSGRASYSWIFNDHVMVKVNCEGEFLTENMNVNTRKINLREVKQKGQKTSLEKLTFKEITP